MDQPTPAALVLVVDSNVHSRAALCEALEDAPQDMPAVDALRELRAASSIPAIVIARETSTATRIAAFDVGADDRIVKPVAPAELVRRVRAVLRRSQHDELPAVPESCDAVISLDPETREARLDGRSVRLTARQFGVLRMLLARRGSVVSPDDLADTVWGYPTYGQPNFVEKQLSGVRKALRELGASGVIENVRSVGWIIR